jgi:tetratricopeptide (TPR) repeat protein
MGSAVTATQNRKSLLLLLFAFTAVLRLHAEDNTGTVTTRLQVEIDNAKGANLRSQTKALVAMVEAKQMAAAAQKAVELRGAYETIFDKSLKQYTFQSQEEFKEFSKSSESKFEWIDWGYKDCLQMQAFIAADRREFPVALAILKTIETVAPVSAGTAAETGYILNQSGNPEEGLSAYRRAKVLSEKYPSQRAYRAAALRGMGYSLIDLKRLDEAEKIFLESLEIEPGNKTAINELAYIRAQRRSK